MEAIQQIPIIGKKINENPFTVAVVVGGAAFAIYKVIKSAKQKWEDEKKKALQKQDPQYFNQKIQLINGQFISILQKINFKQAIKKKDNVKDIMFLGITSSGKSSLISKLFGIKLKIGLGQTTNQTAVVYATEKIRVWDSVGQNSSFQFFNINKLSLLHCMDTICLVYRSTPSSIQNLIKIVCSYKDPRYRVLFVRTCCDQWSADHQRTVDEQIEEDRKILKKLKVSNPIFFKTSAIKADCFENQKLLKSL